MTCKVSLRCLTVSVLLFAASAPVLHAAPITYKVTIDTSSLAGQGPPAGIGLQFNPTAPPPPPGAEPASVSFSNFSSDGTLNGPTIPFMGAVSGDLGSGTLTIANTNNFNLAYQPFTFGNTLQFDVTFAGDALDPPFTSTHSSIFGVTLLNSSGMPVLTSGLGSDALVMRVNADGTVIIVASNPAVQATLAPEPTSLLIFGMGLVAAAGYTYRRYANRH